MIKSGKWRKPSLTSQKSWSWTRFFDYFLMIIYIIYMCVCFQRWTEWMLLQELRLECWLPSRILLKRGSNKRKMNNSNIRMGGMMLGEIRYIKTQHLELQFLKVPHLRQPPIIEMETHHPIILQIRIRELISSPQWTPLTHDLHPLQTQLWGEYNLFSFMLLV